MSGLERWRRRLEPLVHLGSLGLRSASRFLAALILIRLSGQDGYAGFALLLAGETILTTVLASRLAAPLATLTPRLEQARAAGLGRLALAQASWVAWAVALPALSSLPWLTQLEALAAVPPLALAFCFLGLPWQLRALLLRNWHLATLRAERVLVAEIAALGTPLGATLAAPWAGLDALTAFFAASLLGAWLACRILSEDALRTAEEAPAEHKAELAQLGRAMLNGSLAVVAGSRLQPLMLGAVAGAQALAGFAAAATLAGPLRLCSMALGSVLRPRLAGAARAAGAPGVERLLSYGVGGLVLASLALLAAGAALAQPLAELAFAGRIDGLPGLIPLALAYACLEAIGSLLVVAVQCEHSATGARAMTRARVWVAAPALLGLWPACALAGAWGALVLLVGSELSFLLLVVVDRRRLAAGAPAQLEAQVLRRLPEALPSQRAAA